MSLTIEIKDAKGAKAGTFDLPAEIFDVQVNVPLIHQVVTAQLNAARAGTAKTKNRGEVSGGGKKPFKQKGTGRARQGSTRSPNQRHGGERKHRTSGSIGNRTTPGRVFKGKRMMGRMGVETVTVQNLTVQAVDVEKSLILIKGAIPGRTGAQVFIHSASKKALSEVINKAGA